MPRKKLASMLISCIAIIPLCGCDNTTAASTPASHEENEITDDAFNAASTESQPVMTDDIRSPLQRSSSEGYAGYGSIAGYCHSTTSIHSEREALERFEADIGIRIADYRYFQDGIIVELRNGLEIAIWHKEIDCKDPPYDPLAASEPVSEDDLLPAVSNDDTDPTW